MVKLKKGADIKAPFFIYKKNRNVYFKVISTFTSLLTAAAST